MKTITNDLFGNEIIKHWGGKRQNAGRPKIQEKRRILLIEKKLKEFEKQEEPYLQIPPKKQGAHRIACEFLKQLKPLLPQE